MVALTLLGAGGRPQRRHARTAPGLARYLAVVFLSTTGDLLDPGQQAALERWLQSGAAGSASTGPPTPSTVAESTYTGGGMRTDHPIA